MKIQLKDEVREDAKGTTIYEIADLAYHVMVLMVQMGITVEDVQDELASRHIIDHKVKQEKNINFTSNITAQK